MIDVDTIKTKRPRHEIQKYDLNVKTVNGTLRSKPDDPDAHS